MYRAKVSLLPRVLYPVVLRSLSLPPMVGAQLPALGTATAAAASQPRTTVPVRAVVVTVPRT